jgi:hypothetical protein
MRKLLYLLLLIVVFSCASWVTAETTPVDRKVEIPNATPIDIDRGILDYNGLFGIFDGDGNKIGSYGLFEGADFQNKVKYVNIYNTNNEHIYTVIPDSKNMIISIINKEGKSAEIKGKCVNALVTFKLSANLSFYEKPYQLVPFYNAVSVTDLNYTYIETYEDKPIIKTIYKYKVDLLTTKWSFGGKSTVVDKNFLKDYPDDCLALILSNSLFNDLMIIGTPYAKK